MKGYQEIALEVKGLTKDFNIYERSKDMLLELITRKPRHTTFCALDNVSFQVQRGQVTGVIGRNGAGKSTLLRIIAGTLDKTEGEVNAHGRISAILELGTGFHPEYSGRENIYMGGMCLGMSREEIDRKVEPIIAFSELEDVIDKPFKTYSSGMKARLTFSTAISVDPDIFIVDEALAAGDQFFVAKCLNRIEDICKSGATVMFVSHNLAMVERFCSNVIWLESGKIKMEGDVHLICKAYEEELLKSQQVKVQFQTKDAKDDSAQAQGQIRISELYIVDANSNKTTHLLVGKPYTFVIEVESEKETDDFAAGVMILSIDGKVVTSIASYAYIDVDGQQARECFRLYSGKSFVKMYLNTFLLAEGTYFITAFLGPNRGVNSLSEYYDLKIRQWTISVQHEGIIQNTIFEQPATWSYEI